MPRITETRRDPFGVAMWAYMKGNHQAVVKVYSDIAVDDEIPVRYLFRTRSQMPTWEQLALDECRGKVLDIGAGAGSHALALQHAGLEVHAMDVSPGAVEMMKTRGVDHPLHQDIWALETSEYDTLLMMMNGIGLVGDLKGLNRFLETASMWMAPGAQILMDSSDIAYLFENDPEKLLQKNQPYYGIIHYQMSFGNATGEPFDWLYIDFPRLQKHARVFGFTAEKLAEGPHHEYLAKLTKVDRP